MRAPRLLLSTALAAALAGCTGLSLPAGKSSPDPVGLAKLDGLWRGAGKADGLTVRIARAGSSQPRMMYGFRDEAATQPQCTVRAPATLSCKHESGLTTTYTQSGDSTLDFTAQGPKEGDEVLRAQLSRMREP